ncbi:hypothetical protein BU25DRAFT_448019 [Macroventuria anomochaeta]|uniref:Uncharacterized protein n=1 Tax=Macroventuria anomochaeta TaxID=301207 RepID=A0ACB6S5U3_9PLEO|nr:uncharacterized protein BU25DRAFT_448019 [Macroventuria anomochaeta]KAF2628584.1 hypothetical protein BU25DRAFT_448019 [Macroventuria anomochaeta]
MLRTSPILIAVFLACASIVSADFDDFYFASNATQYICPGIGFGCIPPMICAHESVTDLYYCCMPGATDAVCWKGASACDGGSSKLPSGSQQSCSSGDNAFCCLKSREECTATKDQINVCWSTVDNPVANLSDVKMNDTFRSLSSAKPSASSFPISLAQLQATATPTSSLPLSLSASSLSSATPTASPTASATASSIVTDPPTAAKSTEEKGISGGAIGGIVGGVVGGLALVSLIGFLLFRRRKVNSKDGHAPIASGSPSEHEEHGNPYELNAYQQQHTGLVETPVPTEKYSYNVGAATTSPYRDVPEVQGSPVGGQGVHEMQGSAPVEMDGTAPVRSA